MPTKKIKSQSVSVIIPAYNAEKTLPACLDALLNQTTLASEILVVDDGSTDGTKSIVESYSLVKLISQPNQGPAKARNVGARAAKSEIIIFLDSDCVPEKNWLEEMLLPFENEKVVGVQGAYKTKQTSLTARFDQLDIEYRYERMKKSAHLDWIGSYSAAFRKDIFLNEKGFDESFPNASGEDAEFSYRLSEKGYALIFAPNAIIYHTHPETAAKYFRIKFYRAYWRARMYFLHPKKAISDSYTPTELKLNVLFGFAFIGILSMFVATLILLGPIGIVVDFVLLWYAAALIALMILFGFPKLLMHIYQKDKLLLPASIFFIFIRSIAFSFGLMAGILDKRVRA